VPDWFSTTIASVVLVRVDGEQPGGGRICWSSRPFTADQDDEAVRELGRTRRGFLGDVVFDHLRGVIAPALPPIAVRGAPPFALVEDLYNGDSAGSPGWFGPVVEAFDRASTLIARGQEIVRDADGPTAHYGPFLTTAVYGLRIRVGRRLGKHAPPLGPWV
jgi:hypothetical protein